MSDLTLANIEAMTAQFTADGDNRDDCVQSVGLCGQIVCTPSGNYTEYYIGAVKRPGYY